MAWANPTTVNTGDVLQASTWNQDVVANTQALYNGIKNATGAVVTAPVTLTSAVVDTLYDITGLSVSITPTSASSKILIFVDLSLSIAGGADSRIAFSLIRDSTSVGSGAASGNRLGRARSWYQGLTTAENTVSWVHLDSPATTSAVTYKVQFSKSNTALTAYLNRTSGDSDLAGQYRTASSLHVMEIFG